MSEHTPTPADVAARDGELAWKIVGRGSCSIEWATTLISRHMAPERAAAAGLQRALDTAYKAMRVEWKDFAKELTTAQTRIAELEGRLRYAAHAIKAGDLVLDDQAQQVNDQEKLVEQLQADNARLAAIVERLRTEGV